jgi:hypothetical protein
MKAFNSISEMIGTHEAMWGTTGRFVAEAVCRYVTLFDEPLDPLRIRVALAPHEIGGYNRHTGYAQCRCGLILANSHHCDFSP